MPNFFYQRHTFKLFGFVWNINHDQINNKFRKIDKQLIMSITQVNDQIFTSSHLDDRLPQHKVRSNSLLVPTRASTSMSVHEQKQQYQRSQWQHEEKPKKKHETIRYIYAENVPETQIQMSNSLLQNRSHTCSSTV